MLSKLDITDFRRLLTFAMVFMLFWCLGTSAQARRIKVEEDGISLEEAVEMAQNGDVIQVEPGRYAAVDIENKSITLYGAGANKTTLVGEMTLRNMKSGEIYGFKMELNGILCWSCYSVTISHNVFIGSGIFIDSSADVVIKHNTFINSGKGIRCSICNADVIIEYNTFINNENGIRCRGKASPTIRKNVVIGSRGYGITCGGEGASPIVKENIVTQCEIGIDIFNKACPVIENNIIADCKNGILCASASPPIRKNTLINVSISCSGENTSPTIARNTITNGGIGCSRGATPIIKFNTITASESGIGCTHSAPVIRWNTIKGGGESEGIVCCYSNPKIRGNLITGCRIGIKIAVKRCIREPVELVPDIGMENDLGRNTIQKYFDHAIMNEMELDVSAVGNYWGSRFGPKKGDIVNLKGGTVKYKPYLKIDQSLKPLWAVEKQRKIVTNWGHNKREALESGK